MGKINKQRRILFLCTGNSCRSQMAEGWARYLRSDDIKAYSAGIETHGLNSKAVQVMAEAGVDISSQKSTLAGDLSEKRFDLVVTVCSHADNNCPVFPGNVQIVHYGFDDPPLLAKGVDSEEQELNCYRRVRDEIRDFIVNL